ncbi:MAG: hypothetical protein JXB39_09615 [Deltaproteobacteria bacterium]|nr:hypothetical protein [Deltaproteobacteria bacterium]
MPLPHDRIVAVSGAGLYETHALSAHSPDGAKALWIRHTLLRPLHRPPTVEIRFVWFERGFRPRVVRADHRWERCELEEGPSIRGPDLAFSPGHASGSVGGISWDLEIRGGISPILHLPYRFLYDIHWPRKKICTPSPGVRLDGRVTLDGHPTKVEAWSGSRGHSWGGEQAASWAAGTCTVWDDATPRVLDGFTARIRIGRGLSSPSLTCLVIRDPAGDRVLNAPRHWLRHARFEATAWDVRRDDVHLSMACEPTDLVGLRLEQPRSGEGYAYAACHARVTLEVGRRAATSSCGGLETFFPKPVAGVTLHPPASWSADDGPYDSARYGL